MKDIDESRDLIQCNKQCQQIQFKSAIGRTGSVTTFQSPAMPGTSLPGYAAHCTFSLEPQLAQLLRETLLVMSYKMCAVVKVGSFTVNLSCALSKPD